MVHALTDQPNKTNNVPAFAYQTIRHGSAIQRPSIPDQLDAYARTSSFKNWPKGTGVKVSDLVNSGFSYLGINDRVQCFQCGEIFENWREGESVDMEHSRLSPSCTFIQTKLGKLVELPQPLYNRHEFNVSASGSKILSSLEPQMMMQPQMNYSHVVDVPASAQNSSKNLYPVAPRDIRARLDIEASRKLLDMGFKKTLLAQVIGERLAETGDDFRSFMEYFIAVKNAEQVLSGGHVDTLKSFYDKSTERMSNPASLVKPDEPANEATVPETPQVNAAAPSDPAAQSTGSDSSLRRKKECNICMDAEADTVFMPCRHMCSCSTCADKLQSCPICRKPIEHCIKVYV